MPQLTVQQAIDLAKQHHQAGKLAEAEAIYRQVLTAQPNNADALHLLGVLAHQSGKTDVGVDLVGRAIAINPNNPQFLNNYGQMLGAIGRTSEAGAALRQALILQSAPAEDFLNLGNALMGRRDIEGAILAYEQATQMRPNFAEAESNLGSALKDAGRFDHAAAAFERALAAAPEHPVVRVNAAMFQLLRGEFETGFKNLESRWRVPELGLVRQGLSVPTWDGSAQNGKTLLLHSEQGAGDTIQFARYAPLIKQQNPESRILLQCKPELVELMRSLDGVDQVLAIEDALPQFDVDCAVSSLPHVFKTTLKTIPNNVPYLRADPSRRAMWQERVSKLTGLKVGLAWSGRAEFHGNEVRSISLAMLAPLSNVENVSFVSLQKGPAASEALTPPHGMNLSDWSGDLQDFADTAALIDCLDLVISVDTVIPHLAGAMGKPIWTLLSFVPDWRWLIERNDSPWYPTMRLFRQTRRDDWETPIAKVTDALAAMKP